MTESDVIDREGYPGRVMYTQGGIPRERYVHPERVLYTSGIPGKVLYTSGTPGKVHQGGIPSGRAGTPRRDTLRESG